MFAEERIKNKGATHGPGEGVLSGEQKMKGIFDCQVGEGIWQTRAGETCYTRGGEDMRVDNDKKIKVSLE